MNKYNKQERSAKTRHVIKAKCPLCIGEGVRIDNTTKEAKPCWKCGGKGFIKYSDLPPATIALLRDNLLRARISKDIIFIKRQIRKIYLKLEESELRHKTIMGFFIKLFDLYAYSRKKNPSIRMQELMGWMDSMVREDIWQKLKEIEHEESKEKELTQNAELSNQLDLLDELIKKQDG